MDTRTIHTVDDETLNAGGWPLLEQIAAAARQEATVEWKEMLKTGKCGGVKFPDNDALLEFVRIGFVSGYKIAVLNRVLNMLTVGSEAV